MNEDNSLSGLDLTKSEHYTLSVHLCMDGFYFSVYNPLRGNHFSFMRAQTDETLSLTANVKRVFEQHDFLNQPFKRVNIIVETDRYACIPFEMFEEEQSEELFSYTHTPLENEKIRHSILPKCNITALFGMDRFAYSWLTDLYPRAHFYCQIAPLAEYFCSKNRMKEAPELFTVLHEETFHVLGLNRGNLILANTFHYLSAEDLTYYLLSVWQQLELQPSLHKLFIYGESSHKEEAVKRLLKFIRHIENPSLPEGVFGSTQTNQTFTLQALYLCE